MLENEIYIGNTVNYRFSTKSYKDKRKMEHPREECLVFENTHPAIISKEVWDIVQRVRKNKRRPTKMNEQNKYSGLVVCADCGKAMVLHRAHTMSADYNHFTCRTYKKDGEACTAHYIRECILDEIVLEDLRRVTAEAREHPQEFAEYLNSKQSAELQKEIRKLEKEKSAMQKRKAELDAIFKKLYEESVLGRITAEQFQMLVASYTDEQAKLTESLPQRESEIQRLKETVSNTAAFLDKAKRYTDIQALTPELLRLFIQKIVEKEVKWSKHAPQTVEIHYADIGCMENRQTAKPEQREGDPDGILKLLTAIRQQKTRLVPETPAGYPPPPLLPLSGGSKFRRAVLFVILNQKMFFSVSLSKKCISSGLKLYFTGLWLPWTASRSISVVGTTMTTSLPLELTCRCSSEPINSETSTIASMPSWDRWI